MHISDGVLPTSVAVAGFAASALLAAWSVRQTDPDELPKVAVVTSAFFVASLIHIPMGPTSVHLLLPGLVGVLLGHAAFVSILVGIVLQSFLFQFGGITAIGANGLMMGVPALLAGLLFRWLKGTTLARHVVAAGLAGGLCVVMAVGILAGLLATGGEDFLGVARIAVLAHLPVIGIESAVAAFTVSFLYKVKPELLGAVAPAPPP
ncbi:MAG: cobalt transporter CbiM [Syntrophobacteraceae bacterium]|jgi:cobalt/nickel transport system permease protein|nr:cobalt transporter CbiM [Syntrophobacteraceae bacterium]